MLLNWWAERIHAIRSYLSKKSILSTDSREECKKIIVLWGEGTLTSTCKERNNGSVGG